MTNIPDSHPRKSSLLSRLKMVDGAKRGLLADSAMIAHGRGEAYDYLLGEKTTASASLAIREAAARLLHAKRPVISMNGNSTVLAGAEAIKIAAVVGCPIEVNIYYRTKERMTRLVKELGTIREELLDSSPPEEQDSIFGVEILGLVSDGRIRGLEGPRSFCSADGIEKADVVLVPLEDGDRCEALIALGKEVIAIDLNPLSRTSRTATVTIVDEVSRALRGILNELSSKPEPSPWDNDSALRGALQVMRNAHMRI